MEPLVAARALHFASTVMVAGAIFFRFFIAEPAFRAGRDGRPAETDALRRQLTWIVWINVALAIASGAAWLVLLAANISGVPVTEVFSDDTIWTVLTDTRFGYDWIGRLCLVVLVTASWSLLDERRRLTWGLVPVLLVACFLGALGWPGHSGATPGVAGDFYLASDILHLIAAGTWVGGLLPLALLLACAHRASDPAWGLIAASAVRRFSVLGVLSVGTLLATGIVNTWNLVGSLPALTETDYGFLLLLKIGLFVAMVCIAAFNRLQLTPQLGDPDAMRQLQRNSLIEAGLGLIIIAIVGALGTMSPAIHIHIHPAHASAVGTGSDPGPINFGIDNIGDAKYHMLRLFPPHTQMVQADALP
jgi:putative copper resistance protein D